MSKKVDILIEDGYDDLNSAQKAAIDQVKADLIAVGLSPYIGKRPDDRG